MSISKKLPKMTDVANMAGVSQSTVSLVLRGKADNIPQATRERILQVSQELGYSVNRLASSLNSTGSGMIGMLTDELITTNFAGAIIKGAQECALNNDKILMMAAMQHQGNLDEKAVDMMVGYRVESILYATRYHHEVILSPNLKNVPTVLVNCYEQSGEIPCILPDDFLGGYTAANYLLKKGHRDIVYLSNNKTVKGTSEKLPATKLREAGFIKALQEFGLEIGPNTIQAISITGMEVYENACKILKSMDRPTAIMCYNDRMAMGVYSAASAMNIRIPDELSVIGYDNQIVIAEFLIPQVTTINLPHYKMGASAVNYLFKHKYPFKGKQILISPELIVRDSVRDIS